ncbi:MAG: hypothetical protein FD124_3954, partial [Alphaproteobacteria bacterium]
MSSFESSNESSGATAGFSMGVPS